MQVAPSYSLFSSIMVKVNYRWRCLPLMARNWLGEIVSRISQLPTQHFRVDCRLLQYLGRPFVGRNHFKKQFSHIPPQFQFNGNFKQSASVTNCFSSVQQQQLRSFIHSRTNLSPFTKDFRVWETPIETQTIYQASSEEAVSFISRLDLADKWRTYAWGGKHHQTFPNESFHQVIDIYLLESHTHTKRKKNGKLCEKVMKPTAPSVPRRSPIQVLTRLNVA